MIPLTLSTLLLGLVVAFYLLNPQPKEPQTGFFCFVGEGGITHLCNFKCTGCASLQSKPDEPDESNSGESINKNKVCAGIDVLLRMIPHLPPLGNNTNSGNEFVLFFSVDCFGITLRLKFKVHTKATTLHQSKKNTPLGCFCFLGSAIRNFAPDGNFVKNGCFPRSNPTNQQMGA